MPPLKTRVDAPVAIKPCFKSATSPSCVDKDGFRFLVRFCMKLPKKFISIAVVVFLGLLFVSCIKESPPPLRVGVVVWPTNECLYLTRNLGYYDNTPIQLLDYPSNSELMRSYRNGDLEAATITLDQFLSIAETAPDIRIVTIRDISNGGDAIVAKPAIKKLQDLKGQRVGVDSTALGAYVLSRALEQVGMSFKDVRIVISSVTQEQPTFEQGGIDAVVTYEPTVSKLRAVGANLLFDSTQIPGEIIDIMAMRESVVTGQSAAAKALINGWFRALDYLQKHPQDAARRIAPHAGVTPEQFLKSLNGVYIPDVQENQKILKQMDAASLTAVRRLAKHMLDKDFLKKAVDPTSMFDARLVQDLEVTIFKNK